MDLKEHISEFIQEQDPKLQDREELREESQLDPKLLLTRDEPSLTIKHDSIASVLA